MFFLGGIPNENPLGSGNFSVTGFGKDPTNPFSNNLVVDPNWGTGTGPSPMYSANRTAPLFEFNSARLAMDPLNPYSGSPLNLIPPQIPGYLDSLGNSRPDGAPNDPVNFYAYFSAYGNGGYDPNDVNFSSEVDAAMHDPGAELQGGLSDFWRRFLRFARPQPLHQHDHGPAHGCDQFHQSPVVPDHLLGSRWALRGGWPVPPRFHECRRCRSTHQIIMVVILIRRIIAIRTRERDNLTNFHNGKLE